MSATTAKAPLPQRQFDVYRMTVTEILDSHPRGNDGACACGAVEPCQARIKAGELLEFLHGEPPGERVGSCG